jgi:mannose-6-phosphate isomerase-like protein (cupin superfamily)
VGPATRPEWLDLTAIGRFSVPLEGGYFDRHHHDYNELWLIIKGKAKVFSEGAEHYVQAGDVLITQAGDTHDVIEVYEGLEGFFVETGLPGGGRPGHLHNSGEQRDGHFVPARALPPDFPAR